MSYLYEQNGLFLVLNFEVCNVAVTTPPLQASLSLYISMFVCVHKVYIVCERFKFVSNKSAPGKRRTSNMSGHMH